MSAAESLRCTPPRWRRVGWFVFASVLVLVVGTVVGVAAPGRAAAANGPKHPAAGVAKLWSQYPLNPTKTQGTVPATSRPRAVHRPATASRGSGGGDTAVVAAGVGAFAVLVAGGLFAVRWRRRRTAPESHEIEQDREGGIAMGSFVNRFRGRSSEEIEPARSPQQPQARERPVQQLIAPYLEEQSPSRQEETGVAREEGSRKPRQVPGPGETATTESRDAGPKDVENVGEDVAAVLTAAREAAEKVRAAAHEEAERLREEALAEAERLRRDAAEEAERLRAAARDEVERVRAEATATAAATVEAAGKEAAETREQANREAAAKTAAADHALANATREAERRNEHLRAKTAQFEERLQNLLAVFRALTAQLEELADGSKDGGGRGAPDADRLDHVLEVQAKAADREA